MLCRLIVLAEGGTEPIVDLEHNGPPEQWGWADLCHELVARRIGVRSRGTETFLCLLGDELVVWRDRDELSRLLSLIRGHTWGSRLFVVASEGIRPSQDLVLERASLEDWFATALRERVLDLLQVGYDPWASRSVQTQRLRDACSRVASRQRLLGKSVRERRWRYLVPLEKRGLSFHLLTPYELDPTAAHLDADLVIVVPYEDPAEQVEWVEETRGRYPASACCVVTLTASVQPASAARRGILPELAACCERQGLGEPVALTGILELWYLLLRLNDHLDDHKISAAAEIRAVPLDEPPILAIVDRDRQTHVLISSSFYLHAEEEVHLLAAANDVGDLLALAPLGLSYQVEPALTRERLLQIVRTEPAATVWIHMGHAEPSGLQEFGYADFVDTERWLKCWAGHELKLALFLTCASDLIAERFARAGAGIAIGFTDAVETDKPRQVAFAVFQATMTQGLQRQAILAACKVGAQHFTAVHEDPCEVRAYYSLP